MRRMLVEVKLFCIFWLLMFRRDVDMNAFRRYCEDQRRS